MKPTIDLFSYLTLERAMMDLDAMRQEDLADKVRDILDDVHKLLTEEEIAFLDSRKMM